MHFYLQTILSKQKNGKMLFELIAILASTLSKKCLFKQVMLAQNYV